MEMLNKASKAILRLALVLGEQKTVNLVKLILYPERLEKRVRIFVIILVASVFSNRIISSEKKKGEKKGVGYPLIIIEREEELRQVITRLIK